MCTKSKCQGNPVAVLPIIIAPDPRLKVRSAPVERVDDAVRTLMDDLVESMHTARGVGLAAPQVGVTKRVLVLAVSGDDGVPQRLRMANPEIVRASDEVISGDEGCLSLPEHYAEVTRPAAIGVRYIDYEGEVRELAAEGVLATCIQHEVDHLDGIIFVDHLSTLKRNIILRKLIKMKKQMEGEAV